MKADGERYGVDGDAAKIIPLVRQAVELGILPSRPFIAFFTRRARVPFS
jgi:hypothetical protein